MLAYNGSIPGPTLRVQRGLARSRSTSTTTATTRRPCTGTACGSTTATTAPTRRRRRSASAASSATGSTFPDPGVYWYHPHIREDYGQEMGLYGNIIVDPAEPDYWPPAHREIVLTLDDILIEDGSVAPFSRHRDHLLGDGPLRQRACSPAAKPSSTLDRAARRGRPLLPDQHRQHARLQRRDPGRADEAGRRRQRPLRARGSIDGVMLAPSERAVVDVLFDQAGTAALEHRTPEQHLPAGRDHVSRRAGDAALRRAVRELRRNPE